MNSTVFHCLSISLYIIYYAYRSIRNLPGASLCTDQCSDGMVPFSILLSSMLCFHSQYLDNSSSYRDINLVLFPLLVDDVLLLQRKV
jgi:hypothetical protein